ncbi:MAG: hypothetical protein M3N31_00705 [Actinomycetota bacterium]|nr:hypothetical protein [Actinomycetota bacterium]
MDLVERSVSTSNQEDQQALVEQAQQLPGVQEVIETYGKLAPFVGAQVRHQTTAVSYATGGNS